jgi:NAD(P)-dependent dehydrogenase (short-subunit alcohol dehydrogenase family)
MGIKNFQTLQSRVSYVKQFNLFDRVALVTGGVGVLGRHFCAGLAEAGARVAVVDVLVEEARNLANSLAENYGIRSCGYGCDISDPVAVKKMVADVVSEFGEINILHNNAAGKSDDLSAFFAPFEEYDLEEWRKIMSVNLDGMFLVAQSVGKQMIDQGKGGSIIQTASIYGIVAPDKRIYDGSLYLGRPINTPAVYSASKAAVIGLTKYLATYWADKGIRVNTLTPGGVKSGQNEVFSLKYSDRVPMARMASSEEMVGALLYLASDSSSYVTGQNIIVDGGLSCW